MIEIRVSLVAPVLLEDRQRLPWFGLVYWVYCHNRMIIGLAPPPGLDMCALSKS